MRKNDLETRDRLLTARAVSDLFSISVSTLRKWTPRNRLPGMVRLGRSVRWSEKALIKFIARQRQEVK
jgi:predicted DNA-binding transcriptional regulator AlpA